MCVCVCVFLHSLECSRGIRIKKTKVSFQEFTSEPDLQSAGIKMNVLTQVLDFGRDSCGWFDRLLDLFLGRVGKMLYTPRHKQTLTKDRLHFLFYFLLRHFWVPLLLQSRRILLSEQNNIQLHTTFVSINTTIQRQTKSFFPKCNQSNSCDV